jgi:hypothetical protein
MPESPWVSSDGKAKISFQCQGTKGLQLTVDFNDEAGGGATYITFIPCTTEAITRWMNFVYRAWEMQPANNPQPRKISTQTSAGSEEFEVYPVNPATNEFRFSVTHYVNDPNGSMMLLGFQTYGMALLMLFYKLRAALRECCAKTRVDWEKYSA